MKQPLLNLAFRRKLMQISIMQFFLLLITVSFSMAVDLEAQVLETPVTLNVENKAISTALKLIEEQTEIKFIFSPQVINANQKISVHLEKEKLGPLLDKLLHPLRIHYELTGRYILLSDRRNQGSSDFMLPDAYLPVLERKLTGRVTDEKGEGLPGVSIVIKNTSMGTVSDAEGNYNILIPDNDAVLIFSFVGYHSQETQVGKQSLLDIVMKIDEKTLDEVVVTALGLQRKTKALGYAVSEIKNEELTKVPQDNVVNSLTGKVTGVRVINTSPDLNSDPMVLIRGFTSLSGANSPLIVVNGLPTGTDVSILSDLSAENIESVSILKGPSAAALYGSRAGSGVLLITTKGGKAGKKGLGVTVNSAYTASVPYRFVPLQQRFATGSNGQFDQTSSLWWGAEMGTSVARFGTDGVATPLESYPDNAKNFVNTGNSFVNDITVSNANEKLSFSISLSDTRGTGVYPESNLHKDAVAFSGAYNFTNRLRISANFNYLNSGSDNFRGISYDNYPYEDLYFTPNWLDINNLKSYWNVENVKQSVWANGFNNPWFTVHENVNTFRKTRPYGNIKLDWNLTDDLSLMTRIGGFNESYITENRTALSEKSVPEGGYAYIARNLQEINTDFLLNYKKNVGILSLDVSGGGNLFFQNHSFSSITGQRYVLPGLYTASNIDRTSVRYSAVKQNKRINSLYGMASIGLMDAIFLEITGRNDWSSTLPVTNRSYFYPSASLSAVISDLLPLPDAVSLLKIRGGWAKVGKDTSPYALSMALSQSTWGDNTTYSLPSTTPTTNLLPENLISSEIGMDAAFFNKRLGLNFTYYHVRNENQIIGISVSGTTGFTAANVNAGVVENKGVELSLRTVPLQRKNAMWDVTFNFTKEKSTLTALPEGVSNHQFWSRNNIYSQTTLNGTVGDLWGPDIVRVQEGQYKDWPLLDHNGYVQLSPENIKLGNVMPDFMLGLQTNFSYKRFTVSASIDWRQGGDYYSESMKRLTRDGRQDGWYKGDGSSTFTGILSNKSFNGDNTQLANEIRSNPDKYNARDGMLYVGGRNAELGGFEYGGLVANGAFFPGVIAGESGYIENFGEAGTRYFRSDLIADPGAGYWSRGVQTWIYDASFIKLRELAIAYNLPDHFAKAVGSNGVSLSVFARNLMLWTKAKNYIDPESTMMNGNDQFTNTTNYLLGFDRASFYPWTMSMGLKLNIQF